MRKYNEQMKTNTYTWRSNNPEKYKEYMNNYVKNIYYQKNKQKIIDKASNSYYTKQEFKAFLNILL